MKLVKFDRSAGFLNNELLEATASLRLDGLGARRIGVIQSLLVTCQLQGVDPYSYLVDVLQRVGQHPVKRVNELTPRVWKTLFADRPLRSDLDRTRDPPPQ